jgi:uncharacterized membrane protein YphA (DoxX/SURF4 family)
MSLSAKLRRAPLRVVTGAFILNSGLGKLKADEETAKALHGLASGTYGFLGKVDPKLFAKGLAIGEVSLGAAVLAPFVSPVVAGAGVAGFSGALLNMYWQTPGMHGEGNDPRPTQQGMPISKDIWMFGIGVGLMADGLLEPAHDKKLEVSATRHGKKVGRQSRKDKKAAKKARKQMAVHAIEAAKDAQSELSKRAQKSAAKAMKKARKAELSKKATKQALKAQKSAQKSGGKLAGRVSSAVDEYGPTITDRVAASAKSARAAAKDAVDEYGPVVVDRVATGAKTARGVAKDYVDEYGPVVVEKAKTARDAAKDAVDEYGPVVVEKAKAARDVAKDYADEYGPVVAEQAKAARDAAKDAGLKARDKIAS